MTPGEAKMLDISRAAGAADRGESAVQQEMRRTAAARCRRDGFGAGEPVFRSKVKRQIGQQRINWDCCLGRTSQVAVGEAEIAVIDPRGNLLLRGAGRVAEVADFMAQRPLLCKQ